jgi:hypothetical protein
VWTLYPGVPIGCRSPRKGGPFCMPIHTSARGSEGVEAGSTCRTAHSRAACRARRRARPANAIETGLASLNGYGRTWAISARMWHSGRRNKKWRNRIYFCRRRPPVRMSLIRPAKESAENGIFNGFPAASKKRMSGPAALPRSGLPGITTEIPGSFPVISL